MIITWHSFCNVETFCFRFSVPRVVRNDCEAIFILHNYLITTETADKRELIWLRLRWIKAEHINHCWRCAFDGTSLELDLKSNKIFPVINNSRNWRRRFAAAGYQQHMTFPNKFIARFSCVSQRIYVYARSAVSLWLKI